MSSKATARTARVETPQSKDDPANVKVEEIPLPPEALWSELENAGGKTATAAPVAAAGQPARRQALPVARLKFMRDSSVAIPLDFPFEWEGRVVDTITMRRLTVAEAGEMVDALPEDFDFWDFYSLMCDLPAAVLRGLIDADGKKVSEVGYDFLPHKLQPETDTESGSASS